MKSVLLIVAGLVVALVLLIIWMAAGFQSTKTFEVTPTTSAGTLATSTSTSGLTVMSWNVAWAFGMGSEGSKSPADKSREEFEKTLDAMADHIKGQNADIVLLQELDFDCGRSRGIDQVERIAKRSGLLHVAKAESWRANYVPFPYWPPSAHFGHMSSGGAIISRFPIKACEVTLLDKPSEYPFWYRMFYLFRYVEACELDVDGQTLRVVNTHLEAFSPPNRMAQAKVLASIAAAKRGPTIFGGDLNTVPPESPTLTGYPDEPETNHSGDTTLPTLRGVDGFHPVVATSAFEADPKSFFTFPGDAPNRMLDHLFVSDGIEVESASVLSEAGALSDHLPLVAKIRLPAAQN